MKVMIITRESETLMQNIRQGVRQGTAPICNWYNFKHEIDSLSTK